MFHQFILQILNWDFCAFYTSLLALMLFYLEGINPRDTQGCLKCSLTVNMKLFLGEFEPITQASRPPISSNIF